MSSIALNNVIPNELELPINVCFPVYVPLPVIVRLPIENAVATTPVPVTTNTLALPAALILTFPLATGTLILLFPLPYAPVKRVADITLAPVILPPEPDVRILTAVILEPDVKLPVALSKIRLAFPPKKPPSLN